MRAPYPTTLLSALVFPGLGQVWRGKSLGVKCKGGLMILVTLTALGFLLLEVSRETLRLMPPAEALPFDLRGMIELAWDIQQSIKKEVIAHCEFAVAVLFLTWLYGSVDAYLYDRSNPLQ